MSATPVESSKYFRVWPAGIVAGVVVVACLSAALAMSWLRSGQGGLAGSYPSKIEALANHRQTPDLALQAQARGREVYQHYCAICHGAEGLGDGFNSTSLAIPPRNFTDREFWSQTTDERVFFAISAGGLSVGKSVLMPSWGKTLTEDQIRDAIAYLRTLHAAELKTEPEPDETE